MTFKPGIPSQQEADPHNPEEHVVWALRNMPTFAGIGAVTHPGFLRQWSKHLWECGFRHRDYLEGLADENGNIHVSQLPEQTIELQGAFRGPSHIYNNAARWVGYPTTCRTPRHTRNDHPRERRHAAPVRERRTTSGASTPQRCCTRT